MSNKKNIEPLVGEELLQKVKDLGSASKEDKARECGYYTETKNGVERVNMMKFLNALIDSNRTVRVAALGALMFRETLTQRPPNLTRRDSAYAGKRCLFNMQALRMAFFMYADKDQGELFDTLRENYARAGEPGMQEALKARLEKTTSGMQTVENPALK